MIYCVLDGDRVYPSLSQNIKITRENPELKDKGSYTLDVTFPMSIYENQVKFRHLNRIDVSLQKNDYKSATLYVDHLAIISGIGVVTSVSNKEVKLQIMNANSEFKYVSGFDKVYIDEIFSLYESGKYLPGNPPIVEATTFFDLLTPTMIDFSKATAEHPYVGDAGIGLYTPVYDETNERTVNEIVVVNNMGRIAMINPKCQYNLLYVMRMVLAEKGYTADLSALDTYPWNRIFMVNAGAGIPHWTLERFLTEFKKFFNISIRFMGKRVIFGWMDLDARAVAYECLDDFTSEFDDEGLQNYLTSNLRYNLYNATHKTVVTEIPDTVMEKFTILEFSSESAMYSAYNSLTDEQKLMSVFSTPTGYFYTQYNQGASGSRAFSLWRAGHFNKLVRDNADSVEELGMVPVTIAGVDTKFRVVEVEGYGFVPTGKFITKNEVPLFTALPVVACEEPVNTEKVTVQQALEDSEDAENGERQESERMELFFLGSSSRRFVTAFDKSVDVAVIGTDPRLDADFRDKISFALIKAQDGVTHIGQLHTGSSRINGKNPRCIRFLCDEIPDPTWIYIFHNKRYVCEKIEIQITEKGIDQVKTGYFYEIVS